MSLTHSHEMANPKNAHLVEELSKKALDRMKAEAEANISASPFRSRLLDLVEEIAANTTGNGTLDREDVTNRMVEAMAATVGPKRSAEGLRQALQGSVGEESSQERSATAGESKPVAGEEKAEL